jgi:hypothetical protein
MRGWEKFAYIFMRSHWPLYIILALAAFGQGWDGAALLLLGIAAVMFWFGRRARAL